MLDTVAQSAASGFRAVWLQASCRFLIKHCCRLKSWTYFYWSSYLFKIGIIIISFFITD